MKPAQAPHYTSAWIEWPDKAWVKLQSLAHGTRTLRKGQTLFSQGQPIRDIFIILSGRARTVLVSPIGQEKHLYILGKNCLAGESGSFTDGRHSGSAIANSPLVVAMLSIDVLRSCIANDERTRDQCLALMDVKLRITAEQQVLLAYATAEQRVAHHFLQLIDTYGTRTPEGIVLTIDFTHGEMADLTGLSRVMVSNTLGKWARQGIVTRSEAWRIPDPSRIRQLIELPGSNRASPLHPVDQNHHRP